MSEAALPSSLPRQFAWPGAQDDRAQAKAIFGEYAAALLQIGLEQCGTTDPAQAEIAAPRGGALPWSLAWRPYLGDLEQALYVSAPREEIGRAVAALAGAQAAETAPVTGEAIAHRWLAPGGAATGRPIPSDWRVPADPLAAAGPLAAGFDLLTDICPDYAGWVAEAVSDVVLLEGEPGMGFSATVREAPGLTYISTPLSPADVAIRMSHEAAHHNFFALQRLTPLHDGSDDRGYYSPLKRRDRSLSVILFSFHAFGNGAVVQRRLARADPRFLRVGGVTLDHYLDALRVMAGHLVSTSALTVAGEQLWRPLAEELFGEAPGGG